MSKLIEEMYYAMMPAAVGEEVRRAHEKTDPCWKKLRETMPFAFVNEMQTLVTDAWSLECAAVYGQGFLTGARLMLEILGADVSAEG